MDLDAALERLKRCELPTELEVEELTHRAREILVQEPNVLTLVSPITLVGDIHGQFYDLREMFSIGGSIPDVQYLFLGDYVDRGYFSVETFLLLIAFKVKFPTRISLLRGNHESRQISQVYGYNDECLRKYGSNRIWRLCCDVFDALPLAATVDDTLYCIHGGLSPDVKYISTMKTLHRNEEVPFSGPICDTLWSDPMELPTDRGYQQSQRGAGFMFGSDVVQEFCAANNIELIVRSHQLVMEGMKFQFNNKLLTLWSCPNYCYRAGNVAAILEIRETKERSFKVFEAAPKSCRALPDRRCIPDYFL
ncbi:Serine/threonine protein phosphatase 4 [Giardia lamblia P15]|uniref:Serine/threonine-protein phosphatase n=1 Tax=Giardia intestinalis (strain P15) TaxID=658858 RepID=E1EVJ5_GIAIA|nr:Serine/threonine protein phosphatase 4 [Giardia lamblia P15]